MKKYEISAYGDGFGRIARDLSDEQYEFLQSIFEDLETYGSMFSPTFMIREI